MSNVILGPWKRQQFHDEEIRTLTNMSGDALKALWDRYDGTNAPDGHAGEDIHAALNMKGFGVYCAV